MTRIDDPVRSLLVGALDGLAARQAAVTSNLANIDTPGYRPMAVEFERELQAAMSDAMRGSSASPSRPAPAWRTTSGAHMTPPPGAAGIGIEPERFEGTLRNDGNAVDLESEMTALADTQIRYAAISLLLSGRMGMLRDAVERR
jgi:flagellar basal-body rod protein FlgB